MGEKRIVAVDTDTYLFPEPVQAAYQADVAAAVASGVATAMAAEPDFVSAVADITADSIVTALLTSNSAFQAELSRERGYIAAPAPTGVAATDTANLQAAITAAQSAFMDLKITPSPLGAQKNYVINAALTWNLTRGSFYGTGHVGLDFSQMSTSYVGAALTYTGPGSAAGYSHLAAIHSTHGFRMIGHDTDTSTMDGLLFTDSANGIDQGLAESLHVYGFRDNLTFGANVWSITFTKCAFANAHRYGVNLTVSSNAGECLTLRDSSVYGSHNTGGTAVAIYAPATTNVDFRMFGGSLDYNDTEGGIYGGALSFHGVHIEDRGTGAMFVYSQSQSVINVSFKDCDWDSAAAAVRPYIHQILAGSGSKITVTFDGDKGGIYPNTNSTWFVDSTNNAAGDLGIASTIRGWHLDTGSTLLGQFYNLLTNGDFGASSSFVAAPGVGGWVHPAAGTWTIGAGGQPGAALKCVASTATTTNSYQRIPLPPSRQPVRVGGKMMVTALTAGSIQTAVQFYAEDGTTPILGAIRIGSTLTTVDASTWTYFSRRFTPPPGAAYLTVQAGTNTFVGTGLWDEIEVVPV